MVANLPKATLAFQLGWLSFTPRNKRGAPSLKMHRTADAGSPGDLLPPGVTIPIIVLHRSVGWRRNGRSASVFCCNEENDPADTTFAQSLSVAAELNCFLSEEFNAAAFLSQTAGIILARRKSSIGS